MQKRSCVHFENQAEKNLFLKKEHVSDNLRGPNKLFFVCIMVGNSLMTKKHDSGISVSFRVGSLLFFLKVCKSPKFKIWHLQSVNMPKSSSGDLYWIENQYVMVKMYLKKVKKRIFTT